MMTAKTATMMTAVMTTTMTTAMTTNETLMTMVAMTANETPTVMTAMMTAMMQPPAGDSLDIAPTVMPSARAAREKTSILV